MALLFCLGTFFSRQACAQSEHFIEVQGEPSPCFERAKLEEAVTTELGATAVPEGLLVQFTSAESPGFVLKEGDAIVAERHFESLPSECQAQVRMLSVVMAMAIEHRVSEQTLAGARQKPEPSQTPTPEEPRAAPKTAPKKMTREKSSKSTEKQKKWGVRASGGVGYSFGLLPVPAPVVSGELGVVVWRGWSAEVGIMASDRMRIGFDVEAPPGSGLSAPDDAFTQALVQLVAGKAQGCFEPRFEDGALGVCAGLAAGRFHARGVEGFQPRAGQGLPWFGAFSRVTGRAPARGPFGVTLNADIFANFIRPGVELIGEGSVKRPVDTPVAGGVVSLGMFFVVE